MAISTYNGNEPYIFISYAHKNNDVVIPIIEALAVNGFRVWYDAGIEAGTEWPEYVAEKLRGSAVVIAFISKAALESQNCRREINYASAENKSVLSIYIEDVSLSPGMKMQLSTTQAMFFGRTSYEAFLQELKNSAILTTCRSYRASTAPAQTQKTASQPTTHQAVAHEVSVSLPTASAQMPTPMPASYALDGFFIENGVLKKYLNSWPEVMIPDDVTSIGEGIFSGCENLTGITVGRNNPVYHSAGNCIIETATNTLIAGCKNSNIPDYVTGIGKRAFQDLKCRNGIEIPDSVTYIGDHAFEGCTGLIRFEIPDHVTKIGARAFYGCEHLSNITIPDGIAIIGNEAFSKCSNLANITIPDSVTSIGNYAFEECRYLSIYCRAASKPDEWDYRWNPSNRPVHWDWKFTPLSDFWISDQRVLKEYRGKSASVTIPPDNVRYIGDYAFARCQGLTDITISNGVSSICQLAFYCCSALKSVTISEGVSEIRGGAFCGCESLTSITIPNSVTHISSNTFSGCKSLTNITIPDSVTRIDSGAFSGCESLTSIIIPNSVTYVGADAFKGCSNLTIYRKPFSSQKNWDRKWNPDKCPIKWIWKK